MVALVPNPTGADLAEWLGRDEDEIWQAFQGQMFAQAAREAAAAYCRGVGFEDETRIPASLAHVIKLRAVRMAMNYTQLISQTADSQQLVYGAAGQGFTIQELKALDDYRVLAA